MVAVDQHLLDTLEDTRARVRAAQAELARREAAAARQQAVLSQRLVETQRALAQARGLLAQVEAPVSVSTQAERRVTRELLRVLGGVFAIAALAAAVGVLRRGPGWGLWVLVFPLVGAVTFALARAMSKRRGGDGT
jgi:beta-phosphoglucomutase-like phosphatase (HAD superfamily)